MPRAELIKRLVKSYKSSDDSKFYDTAKQIISEERKKRHTYFANELEKILYNGNSKNIGADLDISYPSPPKDSERQVPLVHIKHPDRYFDDIILDITIKKNISQITEEFRGWDILSNHGLSPANKLLFCGPPGCGKTVTAEALATELNLPLLYINFDAVVSSLLGETASNINKIFKYASDGNWIVFFDEFDAVGRSRDDETEHSEIKRVVNSFLQVLDNFNGKSIVIAATNFEQVLDPALWRRFEKILRFNLPARNDLYQLVRMNLRNYEIQDHLIEEIVHDIDGGTYADAEQVCITMKKFCALRGNRTVSKQYVSDALEVHNYRKKILNDIGSNRDKPSISNQ